MRSVLEVPQLEARNLTLTKGSKSILANVDFKLDPAMITVVLGANGSGKTTLLRALAGLESPERGAVFAGAKELRSLSHKERSRLVAWLPAHHDIQLPIRALDLVVWGRYPLHQGFPLKSDYEAAELALGRTGAADLGGRNIASLSSGERQKVFLARILATEAKIIIADEPCSHLDIGASLQIMNVFKALSAEGRLVCLSLHDVTLARNFAKHFIGLQAGRPVVGGPVAQLSSPQLEQLYGVAGLEYF
jgi:iron complex transport system ATP-binding protein